MENKTFKLYNNYAVAYNTTEGVIYIACTKIILKFALNKRHTENENLEFHSV